MSVRLKIGQYRYYYTRHFFTATVTSFHTPAVINLSRSQHKYYHIDSNISSYYRNRCLHKRFIRSCNTTVIFTSSH